MGTETAHTTEWLKRVIGTGSARLMRRLVTPERIDPADMAQMWAELSGPERRGLVDAGAVGEVAAIARVAGATPWRSGRAFDGSFLCSYEVEAVAPGLPEPWRLTCWSIVGPIDVALDGHSRPGREWRVLDSDGTVDRNPRVLRGRYAVRPWAARTAQVFPLWALDGRFVTFEELRLDRDLTLMRPDHGAEPTWEDVEEPPPGPTDRALWIVRDSRIVRLLVWNAGLAYYTDEDEETGHLVGRWWAEAWGVRADEARGVAAARAPTEGALRRHIGGLSDDDSGAFGDEYAARGALFELACAGPADSGDELFAGVGMERDHAGVYHLVRAGDYASVTPNMATGALLYGWSGVVLHSGLADPAAVPAGVYRAVGSVLAVPGDGRLVHVTGSVVLFGPSPNPALAALTDTARALLPGAVDAPRGAVQPLLVLADALHDESSAGNERIADALRAAVAAQLAGPS